METARRGSFPYASIITAQVLLDRGKTDEALAEARKASQLLSGDRMGEKVREHFERKAAALQSA